MPPLLPETVRLLLAHLELFTRLTLTVWLPATVVANYQDFFGAGEAGVPRGVAVILSTELVLGPLVAGAIIAALDRIARGEPASYSEALGDGLAVWPRLFLVRVVTGLIIAGGLLLLVVPGVILLVRYALVDSVAVLEGAGPGAARRRSAELTASQRRDIFMTGGALFVAVWVASMTLSVVLHAVPPLNHFVVRVLLDCAFAVGQTVFTIALFLFYQRGLSGGPPALRPSAASAP